MKKAFWSRGVRASRFVDARAAAAPRAAPAATATTRNRRTNVRRASLWALSVIVVPYESRGRASRLNAARPGDGVAQELRCVAAPRLTQESERLKEKRKTPDERVDLWKTCGNSFQTESLKELLEVRRPNGRARAGRRGDAEGRLPGSCSGPAPPGRARDAR